MKLVTFRQFGLQRPGALMDDGIADLSGAASSVMELIERGLSGPALSELARGTRQVPLNAVQLEAPIPSPSRNIFCVGKNYVAHAKEFQVSGFDLSSQAQEIPDVPIFFTKAVTSVIGPETLIPGYLDGTNSVDYEGELTVVIGRGGRGISRADAYRHVYGYTIINDVTARIIQQKHKQWFLGKSLDGFCPMGPAIVTADEVPDVTRLELRTLVNGEVRQQAKLSDLIFDIPVLIETLSRGTTLMPGDLIATGTPEGVGIGFKPPKFLKSGDLVEITIAPIGTLSNRVA